MNAYSFSDVPND
jgi:hypothetical protein